MLDASLFQEVTRATLDVLPVSKALICGVLHLSLSSEAGKHLIM